MMTEQPFGLSKRQRVPVYRLLEATRGLLVDGGWMRGNFGPPGGPHCLAGALKEAHGGSASIQANTRLVLLRVTDAPNLSYWNDAQSDVKPVLALLDEAMERLEVDDE